jgi:hypothetical protein
MKLTEMQIHVKQTVFYTVVVNKDRGYDMPQNIADTIGFVEGMKSEVLRGDLTPDKDDVGVGLEYEIEDIDYKEM